MGAAVAALASGLTFNCPIIPKCLLSTAAGAVQYIFSPYSPEAAAPSNGLVRANCSGILV